MGESSAGELVFLLLLLYRLYWKGWTRISDGLGTSIGLVVDGGKGMNAGSKLPCARGVNDEARCLSPGGDKRGGDERRRSLTLFISRPSRMSIGIQVESIIGDTRLSSDSFFLGGGSHRL